MVNKTKTTTRAAWSVPLDNCFLKEMKYQADILGKRADTGFKAEAWDACLVALNIQFNLSFTRLQLKTRSNQVRITV